MAWLISKTQFLWRWIKAQKLMIRIVSLMVGGLVLQLFILATFFLYQMSGVIEEQIGQRALQVSQTISIMPSIRDALEQQDPQGIIQPLAEKIRHTTGAAFIVIGDKEGRRYSHPVPERLNQFMVGGDNTEALVFGKSYVSKAVGTLGPSLRGKVPIFNNQQDVIGIVSVGYLLTDIDTIVTEHQTQAMLYIGISLALGLLIAYLLAQRVKSLTDGVEPEDLIILFQERNAILESIREGVIAIDSQGKITMINQAALKHFDIASSTQHTGKPIQSVLPETRMLEVLQSGKAQFDQEFLVHDQEFIVNRIPIHHQDQIAGVVTSFQKKTEIDALAKQLSQIEQYSDLLRAQTHEYSNKLNTISGLISIKAYDKAIELIDQETSGYQELIHFLVKTVSDPLLGGFLLGKYNQAKENKIDLQINRDSSMRHIPAHINREKLLCILGNVLDNAFEAVNRMPLLQRRVWFFMTDLGNDLVFEIEDWGIGIDPAIEDQIFQKGVSTKEGLGHGVGLYLARQALDYLRGELTISQTEDQHTVFTIYIPKKQSPSLEADHEHI